VWAAFSLVRTNPSGTVGSWLVSCCVIIGDAPGGVFVIDGVGGGDSGSCNSAVQVNNLFQCKSAIDLLRLLAMIFRANRNVWIPNDL